MIMISERPAEIEDRAVRGHWEGDLIMGEANKTAIATLVERATRYTMLVHLPQGHRAEAVRDGLIATIDTLPVHLRGSLTWDQGCEMARHKQFSIGHRHRVLLLRHRPAPGGAAPAMSRGLFRAPSVTLQSLSPPLPPSPLWHPGSRWPLVTSLKACSVEPPRSSGQF